MSTEILNVNPSGLIADVAVLRKEVEHNYKTIEKLEGAIEKIGNVAGDVAKILAVHDERIQKMEDGQDIILTLTEKRRKEMQDGLDKVNEKLDDLKLAQDDTKKELLAAIASNKQETDERLDVLERWRWILTGAGLIIGFILGKVPFISELVKQTLSGG